MSALAELQEWYLSQCNDDWEHTYGVSIDTLDNPGWSLKIELTGTNLEGLAFEERSYGVGDNASASDHNWVSCKIDGSTYFAYGGPRKLEEIINVFLSWAKQNA